MKFIKGFVVTIALYVGLSLLFTILVDYLSDPLLGPLTVALRFSSLGAISEVFYMNLANPVVLSVFLGTVSYIAAPTDVFLLFAILGSVVPVIVAALIGSVAERKSGSVKYIFLSTFVGLLVAAVIGIILQIVGWIPLGGTYTLDFFSKFLTGGLIMSALNAFIWCAIGVFITSKGWG
ncbi:MAG: hypothetical protein JW839_16045 [Candidatus Lokiarchaeota archaeon]|nr:hypothetical protein [Candidatus Lokiarchaeota archaeon]